MTVALLSLLLFTTCKKDIVISEITLNQIAIALEVGQTTTLIATIHPENATYRTLIWESSVPDVATVIGNGLVTALAPGKTTIMARTEDGSKTAVCAIKVADPMTSENLLTQENGWKLTTFTSVPPYVLFNGEEISNMFEGFLYECELDDIIVFYKNYSQYLKYGKFLCDWDSGSGVTLGNWKIKNNESVLEFQLPYFFDINDNFARLEGRIVTLDNNTLKIDVPLEFDDGGTAKRGLIASGRTKAIEKYVFTLTYSKVN